MTETKQTAAVVGAGVLGRLLALSLTERSFKVDVFEAGAADHADGCSWVGAGMLHPFAELEHAEPVIAALGERSIELWRDLLGRLEDPVYFQQEGSLTVAHPQDWGDFERFRAAIAAKRAGVERDLGPREVAELEPELANHFHRGLFFPDEAQIEPLDLLPALHKRAASLGARFHFHQSVEQLEARQITFAEGRTRSFDWVFDVRGMAAKSRFPKLRGVLGELIRIHAPEVELTRPVRLMHPRYPLYVVPRPNHHYIIGATSIESENLQKISVRSALELLSAAYSLHSGFAEARIIGMYQQLRPAFPDNLPRIFYAPGHVAVNGLYRHGFLVTPALVEEVMRLVASGKSDLQHPQLVEDLCLN